MSSLLRFVEFFFFFFGKAFRFVPLALAFRGAVDFLVVGFRVCWVYVCLRIPLPDCLVYLLPRLLRIQFHFVSEHV